MIPVHMGVVAPAPTVSLNRTFYCMANAPLCDPPSPASLWQPQDISSSLNFCVGVAGSGSDCSHHYPEAHSCKEGSRRGAGQGRGRQRRPHHHRVRGEHLGKSLRHVGPAAAGCEFDPPHLPLDVLRF